MSASSRRRFLFLYSETGAGHRSGALAVREALQQRHGAEVEITLCDGLQTLGRWPFDRFPRWWPAMTRLGGAPWGAFYGLTNHPLVPQVLARLLLPLTAGPVARLLAAHPAEGVVSFHPLFTHTFGMILQRRYPATPLVNVVLDLVSIHAAWCAPVCARIFVPTAEAAARALAWGMAPERVICAGLPVHSRFVTAARLDPAVARARLGLPEQPPMVLVTGGGDAPGPLLRLVRAVRKAASQAQLIVITGRNAALRQALVAREPGVRVEGFVGNMELWLRAADVLLTKAGPNTLAEALIMGLPMVLYQAIPGEETGNVEWTVSRGAAVWAPQPQRAAEAVAAVLADPARRAGMQAAALTLARPAAADVIAAALWQFVA
ncbi:MAG TPA: glycosyltransferase [Anaerolineae bacterium]|nr:glycosyltransferase [Anaerolineae bacterium]HQM13607.1 glycosyltransferase [Anaerolineae bacterium]